MKYKIDSYKTKEKFNEAIKKIKNQKYSDNIRELNPITKKENIFIYRRGRDDSNIYFIYQNTDHNKNLIKNISYYLKKYRLDRKDYKTPWQN